MKFTFFTEFFKVNPSSIQSAFSLMQLIQELQIFTFYDAWDFITSVKFEPFIDPLIRSVTEAVLLYPWLAITDGISYVNRKR